MSIIDEEWTLVEDTAGELDVYREDGDGTRMRVLASDSTSAADKARARLAAAAPRMARLLLERVDNSDSGRDSAWWYCGWCGTGGAHKDDCRLVAVLTAAGVLPHAASGGSSST